MEIHTATCELKKSIFATIKTLLQYLLMPFAWMYGVLTGIRNRLYDKGVFTSYRSPIKTIVIGNLRVGGVGKTPHTAMLYKWLSTKYKTAILLRGYGRKSKGLRRVTDESTIHEVGDEAFWYHQQLNGSEVVVAEKREEGLKFLENEGVELVLLDDAYQHRAVTCNVNLLLTEYSLPYYDDHVLPWGRLREWKTGDKRAHIVIVTKCPKTLTLEDKIEVINAVNPYDHQQVFFTGLKSGEPYALKGEEKFSAINFNLIVAVSGIANPEPFIENCRQLGKPVRAISFADHHDYTIADMQSVVKDLTASEIVVITEKDAVKIKDTPLMDELPNNIFFVLPSMPYFLFNEENKFREQLLKLL
ncbi:MAG: tetraacyldisaccharide 4'-kinase [Bacteroidota bacterium]